MTALTVVRAGWATTVQDGGRPGLGALGVPSSGALDEPVRQLLDRLLGNPPSAAVVETLGGLRVCVDGPAVVATSADQAATSIGPGDEVAVEPAAGDLWAYLAVRGGIAVRPVLGSRSTESRSGLGPPTVIDGSILPIGDDPSTPIVLDQVPRAERTEPVVRIFPGPRADWFAAGTLDDLASAVWTVSTDVSRVGVRLDGPTLRRVNAGELPSEGVVPGAVQVPPDGRPVIMLADHPTTGGYPVVAVLDRPSLAAIAQARPGTLVRFHLVQ